MTGCISTQPDAGGWSTIWYTTASQRPARASAPTRYIQGLLWIGYYQSGLDYTPEADRIFDIFSYSNYFDTSQMTVRAVAMHGDEMLIGTREGLYYLNRGNGLTTSFSTPVIRSNIIFATPTIRPITFII